MCWIVLANVAIYNSTTSTEPQTRYQRMASLSGTYTMPLQLITIPTDLEQVAILLTILMMTYLTREQYHPVWIRSLPRRLNILILTVWQDLKLHSPRPYRWLARKRLRRRWRYSDDLPAAREPKISKPLRTRRALKHRIFHVSFLPPLASTFPCLDCVRGDLAPHT